MEEEGSVRVLDGSQITAALPTMAEKAQKKFKEIDTANKGYVTPADVKSAAVSEAAALLLGTQVSAQVFDSAIKGVPLPEATTLNQEAFATSLIDCLRAIANALHGKFLSLHLQSR